MQSTIKDQLANLLSKTIKNLALSRNITVSEQPVKVEYPPNTQMGHYATPIAMELAKVFKDNPRKIAESILEQLGENKEIKELFRDIKIEGPGFLNFFLSHQLHFKLLQEYEPEALEKLLYKEEAKEKVNFEFVSANPTGPLNIVSARSAAVGDCICRVLKKTGYRVTREYYVNDYGNQVRLLGLSFGYRHLQALGASVTLPDDCYQGGYIEELRSEIVKETGLPEVLANTPTDVKECSIENEQWAKYLQALGDYFGPLAIEKIRSTHEADLKSFGVEFDTFFSEKTLHEGGQVEEARTFLEEKGVLYEQEGASLFKSTKYGDDKDRVVVRSDGRPTYLLADIAYHKSKIDRGFEQIYDIWGPDHHGYIARLSGAITAMGFGEKARETFGVIIVQQVNMIEDGVPVVMSKRLGKFHTMKDLLVQLPVDVVRYFFLMRSQTSHLDFDIDLAMTQSNKNPVYYIQYAYARINSIFREANVDIEKPVLFEMGQDSHEMLSPVREKLLLHLWRYFEVVGDISRSFEVHILTDYLYETASLFTGYYHDKENRILDKLKENPEEGKFLLRICQWTKMVLQDGLDLLGVSAPEKM
ncbi:MAG: arginine--tRNA ligase [Leptospirales bacterium]